MQKNIILVRMIGCHWRENLCLDLMGAFSITERESEQGDMPNMAKNKLHVCLKPSGDLFNVSSETFGKIFTCTCDGSKPEKPKIAKVQSHCYRNYGYIWLYKELKEGVSVD